MKRNEIIDNIGLEALGEAQRSAAKEEPFKSPYDGYGLLHKEMEELWYHVRYSTDKPGELRREALHVAAMALRFAAELT